MIKIQLKIIAVLLLFSVELFSETSILYKGYFNKSYADAKNSIMAGATTATAKGYSAMLSNPAGLSTNYNIVLYTRTVAMNSTDSDGVDLPSTNPADHISAGALYDSFGLEYKVDDYFIAAGAYGFESNYGLFSIGVSYLSDQTNITLKADSQNQNDEFATGDYLSYGLMWQKTFVGLDDYYAIYVGLSHKNSGQYTGEINTNIIPVSASRTNYGIGFETNLGSGSILVTLDMSNEYWQSVSETLSGMSYGLKWLIGEKFAIGAGMSNQTFSGSVFSDIQTIGTGVEFGFLGIHTNIGATQRSINDANGVYLEELSAHLDIALAF